MKIANPSYVVDRISIFQNVQQLVFITPEKHNFKIQNEEIIKTIIPSSQKTKIENKIRISLESFFDVSKNWSLNFESSIDFM